MLACTLHHRSVHDGRLVITGEAPHLTFTDAEGRPYGTLDADPAPNLMAEARSALRNLGFSAAQASAAVDRARAHVGTHASLEELLRAALRVCHAPGAS